MSIKSFYKRHSNKIKTYLPFLALFIIVFVVFRLANLEFGDDQWFRDRTGIDLFEYLSQRWGNWSSRIIIESIMMTLLKMPSIIWAAISAGMLTLAAFSISKIFTNFTAKTNLLVATIVCLYPLIEMGETGWYATSLNYLLPLGLGLFSLVPIANVCRGRKTPKILYPLYSIALLIACNQEQMCALILGFHIVFIVYLAKVKKIHDKYLYFQLFLAILGIMLTLICPGNSNRTSSEIANWYPEFGSFGVITKAFLGFATTILTIIYEPNLIVVALVTLLPILCIKLKNESFLTKIISFIPIGLIVVLNNYFHAFNSFELLQRPKVFLVNSGNITFGPTAILTFVICALFVAAIFYTIFKTFKKEKFLLAIILAAGMMSRFIIGFSPTIYASGIRTYMFLDFSMIIVILFVMMAIQKKDQIVYRVLFSILGGLVILQMLNTYQLAPQIYSPAYNHATAISK